MVCLNSAQQYWTPWPECSRSFRFIFLLFRAILKASVLVLRTDISLGSVQPKIIRSARSKIVVRNVQPFWVGINVISLTHFSLTRSAAKLRFKIFLNTLWSCAESVVWIYLRLGRAWRPCLCMLLATVDREACIPHCSNSWWILGLP